MRQHLLYSIPLVCVCVYVRSFPLSSISPAIFTFFTDLANGQQRQHHRSGQKFVSLFHSDHKLQRMPDTVSMGSKNWL